VLAPAFVTACEAEQLCLGIREVASSGDIAEPRRELPVTRAAVLVPPIPIVHHRNSASILTKTSEGTIPFFLYNCA
jgi:hypothetical protein